MCVPALLMILKHSYLQHERSHLILHLIWGKVNPCTFSPISRSCLWEGSQSSPLARWGQPPEHGGVLQVKTKTYLRTILTSISWRSLKLVPPLTDILKRQTLLIKVLTVKTMLALSECSFHQVCNLCRWRPRSLLSFVETVKFIMNFPLISK